MPEGSLSSRTILISGTHLWNPGDDFVRNGVIRLLREALPAFQLNFLFYDFNPEEVRSADARRMDNRIAPRDLAALAPAIDAVVIAGLSAGSEIEPLYHGILAAGLDDRVFLIGAGYENNYAATWLAREPAATIFRRARIVTGRTSRHPAWMEQNGLSYHHLNCPAILAAPAVRSVPAGSRIRRVLFSIQLPHEIGTPNQATGRSMFELAAQAIGQLGKQFEVALLAHHKSEFQYFATVGLPDSVPVLFSSFEEDLASIYPKFDLVITTRLHAALYANGHGLPAIVLNDTDRHTHCLEGFPHVAWARDLSMLRTHLDAMMGEDPVQVAADLRDFKARLLDAYVRLLKEPLLETLNQATAPSTFDVENPSFDSELKEQRLVRRLVGPGMTVLDVGAHLGKYTRLLSSLVGSAGRVVAFEPTPASAGMLDARLKISGIANVEIRQEAVFSCPGEVELHEFPRKFSSWNSLGIPSMPDPGDPGRIVPVEGTRRVAATSLDAFCQSSGITQVDYLKLDVEGVELDALRGARSLLEQRGIRFLQFEVSRKPLEGMGRTAKGVFDFLASQGYEVHAITPEGAVGAQVTDSDAFFDNYIAMPAAPEGGGMPVHVFTIVLNGMPFIRHHIEVLRRLPFPWHWHVVEGVADLRHDTAWSLARGGFVSAEAHREGRSTDGTSEYLDELAELFPGQVSVYRKPRGEFWDGKLEMVNAPLGNVPDGALLWQVDADELWTAEQMVALRKMFLAEPGRTAAYFWCHFFVTPDRVIGTRDTYGNQKSIEWLRAFHFRRGCRWVSHEPPVLEDAAHRNLAALWPFTQDETECNGLVFQHFAYADEAQLAFKETYYGYAGATTAWRRLIDTRDLPVRLADYFPWVEDEAQVVAASARGIEPLAVRSSDGSWTFRKLTEGPGDDEADTVKHILWVRLDAIGDNLLAASMLEPLRGRYPKASLTVLCQPHVAELYAACPFVDDVLTLDKARARRDSVYLHDALKELRNRNIDLCLHSVYSREPIGDAVVAATGAARRVGHFGDDHNRSPEQRPELDAMYTELVPPGEAWDLELCRHEQFLAHLGVHASGLQPVIWTTEEDERRAESLLREAGLTGRRFIGLFPGAQYGMRVYGGYAPALGPLLEEDPELSVVALGSASERELSEGILEAFPGRSVNLCGRLTLRESASVLRRCIVGVGAETGLAHMACAVGVLNVVVLGGGHFGRFMPYSPLTTCAVLPLSCFLCDWSCPYSRPHCVKDLQPRVLTAAIRATLSGTADRPRIVAQDGWSAPQGGPDGLDLSQHLDETRVSLTRIPCGQPAAESSGIPGLRAAPTALVTFPHRPIPANTGANTRFLSQLSMLRDLGYNTHLLASSYFSDQPWSPETVHALYAQYGALVHLHVGSHADRVWDAVHALRKRPLDLRKQLVPGFVLAYRELLGRYPPDLLLVNYVAWTGLLDAEELPAGVLRVQENHDLTSINAVLQADLESHLGERPFALETVDPKVLDPGFPRRPDPGSLPAFRDEVAALDRFDLMLAISAVEADLVRSHASHVEILHLPMSFETREHMDNSFGGQPVFLASANYFNIQAYLHTAARLAPRFPAGMELQVIGGVGKTVAPYPGLRLRGFVDDLAEAYRQAPFAVCPLLGGTGQQVKIVEAMAHGIPVIAYREIARSSPIVDGVNGLLADTPEAFLDHCAQLWSDRARCRRLGSAALETVRNECNYRRSLEAFEAALARFPKEPQA